MAHEINMGSDGLLRVKMWGDFGKLEGDQFYQDMSVYLESANAENPVNSIMDIEGIQTMSAAARKHFTDLNSDPRFGYAAFVKAPRPVRVLTKFILKATGRKNIEFFYNESDAAAWLLSLQPAKETRETQ